MTPIDEEAPHIEAIRRSKAAGFRFLHLAGGDHGVEAIHAERRWGGVVETYTVRSMTEAIAARFREADYPHGDPLWQEHGTVEAVITALLALPRSSGGITRPRNSGLWTPGGGP